MDLSLALRRVAFVSVTALWAGCGDGATDPSDVGVSPDVGRDGGATGDGGVGASDAGVGARVTLEVAALASTASLGAFQPTRGAYLLATVGVGVPASRDRAVPVAPPQFALVFEDGTSILALAAPTDEACTADRLVEPGGQLTCVVVFDVALSMRLSAVRFEDIITLDSIQAATPSATVPPLPVSDDARVSDLTPAELESICASLELPSFSDTDECLFGGQTFSVSGRDDASRPCAEQQLPLRIQNAEGCLVGETFGCTIGQLRACVSALADDLCAFDAAECMCVGLALGPAAACD